MHVPPSRQAILYSIRPAGGPYQETWTSLAGERLAGCMMTITCGVVSMSMAVFIFCACLFLVVKSMCMLACM